MSAAVDQAERETKEELDRLTVANTDLVITERDLEEPTAETKSPTEDQSWRTPFRWTPLLGAVGFYQVLLQGIYINNEKILKSSPIILDINTPLILAPPLAARTFYASISGALPLDSDGKGRAGRSPFWQFPCLNPPILHFEFDRFPFPVLHGPGGLGGRFSLGRVRRGSGYCVGAVVEWDGNGNEDGKAGDGLGGVWVVGEGFFREVGAVFDVSIPPSLSLCLRCVYVCLKLANTSVICSMGRQQWGFELCDQVPR